MSARRVHFFEAKAFGDLFTFATEDKAQAPKPTPWTFRDYNFSSGREKRLTINITSYCCVRGIKGYRGLWVQPTHAVIDAIRANMIPAGINDEISFEVVERADGTALICAKNSAIIGSMWLAVVPVATLPLAAEEASDAG